MESSDGEEWNKQNAPTKQQFDVAGYFLHQDYTYQAVQPFHVATQS